MKVQESHSAPTTAVAPDKHVPLANGADPSTATGDHVAVWLAGVLQEQFPHLCASYGTDKDRKPVAWLQHQPGKGWRDLPMRQLQRAGMRILKPRSREVGSLQATFDNALFFLSANVLQTPASDLNTGTNYMPFSDSSKGLSTRDAKVAEVPIDALMSARLGATDVCDWRGGIWDKALDAWFPDPAVKRTVLMALGQALLGNKEQRLLFLQGTGGEGKSVFVKAILAALGDFAATMPIEMLLAYKHLQHPTGLSAIEGSRVVVSGEVPANATWDEGRLKDITGGDMIEIRRMREDFRSVPARCLLVVYGNHLPKLRDVGESMRRRLLKVPFAKPETADPDLGDKLHTARDEVFSSIVWGLSEYHQHGIVIADAIATESDDYLSDEDSLAETLDVLIDPAPGEVVVLADIRKLLAEAGVKMGSRALKKTLEVHYGWTFKNGAGNKMVACNVRLAAQPVSSIARDRS